MKIKVGIKMVKSFPNSKYNINILITRNKTRHNKNLSFLKSIDNERFELDRKSLHILLNTKP